MQDFLHHLLHHFSLPLKNPVLVFSVILFVILLAPILLKRFNIPGIIGLIISGLVIGPYGLNILEKNSATELFSTIGLLYIMFIAGLELDLQEFKSHRNKSLVFGFFTFIIPLAIGYPVCRYLLGYDFNASFLTASMFSTHTLLAYPIVSRLGIARKQAVAITVGGTILTDTAVLIILAVIMGNHQGGLGYDFWVRLIISLAIFSVIMFAIVPRVARWFFQKLESEKHAHYIFVLSVVFFAAFLSEVAGVEPIIGAFVAGLALNRLIPHSSALMNRIEFIGNALFIPFFLISVGMLVDIRVLLKGPEALIVAGTLSAVALAGKWGAAFLTQTVFRYSLNERRLIFGLSSAHAAATLAVIMVGFRAGIIDENILNGTIVLILITCLISSLETEKAARKIVAQEENVQAFEKSITPEQPEHILLPVANVSNLDKLMEFALLVKDHKSAQPISILTVVPNNEEAEVNILKSKERLDAYVRQASATEVKVDILATIDHNAASGIARTSREVMANMIVLGWPQRAGFLDKIIGEKIESIVNNINKCIFISHFEKNLVACQRILLLTPPLAEREQGFEFWFAKVCKLAQELSLPVLHFGDEKTQQALQQIIKAQGVSASFSFRFYDNWESFPEQLATEVQAEDLLVVITSRKSSVSHLSVLDNIPQKLDRHFKTKNKIIIYPQQYDLTPIE